MADPTQRTGSVNVDKGKDGKPLLWPSGRLKYFGRVRWPDKSRPRVNVPEAHCKTEALAAAFVKKTQAGIDAGGEGLLTPTVDAAKARIESDAWVDAWIADRKRRGLTSFRENESHWREHIAPALAGKHVRDWTAADLRALSRALDDKVQAGTFKWKTAGNVWGTATKMCSDAMRSKLDELRVRTDNPARDIEGPDRGAKTAKQYLYPSEFLDLVRASAVPLQWRRMVALLVYLYPRPGELRELRWDDVDLVHGTVHFHQATSRVTGKAKSTKTEQARRFNVEPALMPLLRRMHAERGDRDRVIDMPSDRDLARGFRLWLERAGVKRPELHRSTPTRKAITAYDLRASGITWLAIRGDDPLKIMQRAGHADFKTTQGYIRVAESVKVGFGDVFPTLPELGAEPSDGSSGPPVDRPSRNALKTSGEGGSRTRG